MTVPPRAIATDFPKTPASPGGAKVPSERTDWQAVWAEVEQHASEYLAEGRHRLALELERKRLSLKLNLNSLIFIVLGGLAVLVAVPAATLLALFGLAHAIGSISEPWIGQLAAALTVLILLAAVAIAMRSSIRSSFESEIDRRISRREAARQSAASPEVGAKAS